MPRNTAEYCLVILNLRWGASKCLFAVEASASQPAIRIHGSRDRVSSIALSIFTSLVFAGVNATWYFSIDRGAASTSMTIYCCIWRSSDEPWLWTFCLWNRGFCPWVFAPISKGEAWWVLPAGRCSFLYQRIIFFTECALCRWDKCLLTPVPFAVVITGWRPRMASWCHQWWNSFEQC